MGTLHQWSTIPPSEVSFIIRVCTFAFKRFGSKGVKNNVTMGSSVDDERQKFEKLNKGELILVAMDLLRKNKSVAAKVKTLEENRDKWQDKEVALEEERNQWQEKAEAAEKEVKELEAHAKPIGVSVKMIPEEQKNIEDYEAARLKKKVKDSEELQKSLFGGRVVPVGPGGAELAAKEAAREYVEEIEALKKQVGELQGRQNATVAIKRRFSELMLKRLGELDATGAAVQALAEAKRQRIQ